MKTLQQFLLVFAIMAISPLLKAQSVDDILAKHIEAIGGKEKLAAIKSVRMETTLSINGADAAGSTIVINGKGYRSESDWSGQKVIQVYTDKSGWTQNPFMGINDPTALADELYKMGQYQIYIVPLLDYASRGGKAELLGQEKVGDANTYKIKLTDANGLASTYFFDPTTYYLIKSITALDLGGQKTDVTTTYSDYMKTDNGWMVAQNTGIDFGGQFNMTSKINKVEINGTVDPGIFEMKK